jgi:hypothetical protein
LDKWPPKEHEPAPFRDLENHFNEHNEDFLLDDDKLIDHGLLFTLKKPMPDLIIDEKDNQESKIPSRILLTKLFVEAGASICF